MKSVKDILKDKELTSDARNKYEFQAYGNRLAKEFDDLKHRALYIKLAKETNRALLEQARAFVVGQKEVTTKGRLFMWKLKQLNGQDK